MRVQMEEWRRFIPGVRMYKDKKTLFWNGEKLWEGDGITGRSLIHDWEERDSWEVVIILPGVEIIPEYTFVHCLKVKTVIMADSVRRIEREAFSCCYSLEFVKLSRNLEYIGEKAFSYCSSLASFFIPPSCTEIATFAFERCNKLIILGLPQNVELGAGVFKKTALLEASSIEFEEDDVFINEEGFLVRRIHHDADKEREVVQWIRSINNGEVYALHRACASYNPLPEIFHELMKQQGIKALCMPNSIGITPSQYLAANTFAEISEKDIINSYILDMMGEVL
ncbi:hypothetical protein CTEN210_03575 [Chaetoceros tenuissimus]|uniref:Leucine-rich repeat domain-containing protein n=1 Tax=Chaetoceros tenuissimus TaxID=426638 RepID=A0AAD3CLZ1_9STRA|nr:hypothetical protein CTEN210_03575 [Chaetoceros tenuissimus]